MHSVDVRISCATLYCQVRGAVGWPVVVGRLGGAVARTGNTRAGVVYDRIWSAAVSSVLLAELFFGSGI